MNIFNAVWKIIILIYLCAFFSEGFAQNNNQDSTKAVDSLLTAFPDSLVTKDTTAAHETYDVDTVIYASATDSLFFFINQKKMDLYGKGNLRYKGTDLKSADISVNFANSNVHAEGVPSDTLPGKYDDTPVLTEDGEVYDGFKMTYNFKTSRGLISSAGTKMEGAYYNGEKVKKVDKNTYFIKDGTYTTCNAKPPHYYFYANEMKVIQKKELVAKWIWLYFGGVPFPVPLPFAVFPIQSGRRSGILVPSFGNDPKYGYYFSRFGYFWAINDYMDINLTADYYTRGSYSIKSRFRYAKRYDYSGSLSGGYSYFQTGEKTDPNRSERIDWNINWNHHQSFTPTLRLDANLEFMSGNYLTRNVQDLNLLLRKDIVSNATLFKSWDESGNSLSLSYSRRQTLQSGDISEVLPNLNFSMSQKYPFRSKNHVGEMKWYDLVGYSYNGQFENQRNKSGGHLSIRGGIQHVLRINASPKVGHFNISPAINYNEKWYNKRIVENYAGKTVAGQDSIVTNDIHQINMVRTFDFSLSSSTRFYGMFQPEALGIAAIRHTVMPSISYNYRPDFSKPLWGYYGSYTDGNGKVIKYDKFQREVYGGVSSGEQQSLAFNLGNKFEMKTMVDPTDTTSKAKKIELLNLNASMSYNFAADSLKFSNLNLNYRTQIGQWLSFSGASSFTPYDYSFNKEKINKFLISEGKGLLRLQNFNVTLSTSLSGEKLKSSQKDTSKTAEQETQYDFEQNQNNVYQGIYNNKQADFSIPWNISLNYNYNLNKPTPALTDITSNISGSLDFNLTPKWKISFTGSYDLRAKQFAAPEIRISRDLHAWILNFRWNPIGLYRGYFLEIRVKAPQLQDLKITKRDQFYEGK